MIRKLFAAVLSLCLAAHSLYGVSGFEFRVPSATRQGGRPPDVWRTSSTCNAKHGTRNAVDCFWVQAMQEPVLSFHNHAISVPTEVQIINWVRETAALNQTELSAAQMHVKAARLIHHFLPNMTSEDLYFLDRRLGLAYKAIVTLRRESGDHSASVRLNSAYEHLRRHVKELGARSHFDPKKEAHLKELWLKLFRLYGGIAKASGHAMDPDITVHLGPRHTYAIRVGLSDWTPAIEEWAKGFEIHLDRKLPTEPVQGIWTVIFHTRLKAPRSRQTPGEGRPRRHWLWVLIQGPLEALFGPAIVAAVAASLFTTGIGNGDGDGERHFPYPYPDISFPRVSFGSQALAIPGFSDQRPPSPPSVREIIREVGSSTYPTASVDGLHPIATPEDLRQRLERLHKSLDMLNSGLESFGHDTQIPVVPYKPLLNRSIITLQHLLKFLREAIDAWITSDSHRLELGRLFLSDYRWLLNFLNESRDIGVTIRLAVSEKFNPINAAETLPGGRILRTRMVIRANMDASQLDRYRLRVPKPGQPSWPSVDQLHSAIQTDPVLRQLFKDFELTVPHITAYFLRAFGYTVRTTGFGSKIAALARKRVLQKYPGSPGPKYGPPRLGSERGA